MFTTLLSQLTDYYNSREEFNNGEIDFRRVEKDYFAFLCSLVLSIKELEEKINKGCKVDKQIKKVEKDVDSGKKAKGKKDIKVLKKMDKKMDAKVAKCSMMGKKKA